MKITKKIVCLVLICIFAFSSVCMASDEQAATDTDESTETATQVTNVLNTDLYVGNDEVVVEGVVNGNAFVMGNTVTITGAVVGDLFVLANTVTIEEGAVIYSNVFALANTFIMNGNAYDIYILANSCELASTAYIYRDVRISAETVSLNGLINKNAYIVSDNITIPEDAESLIGGNLDYTSSTELDIPEDAVLGDVSYTASEEDTTTLSDIISSYVTNFANTIVYSIVVILLAIFFAPKFIEKANYALIKRPFASAGIGILAVVLVPVMAVAFLTLGFLNYVSFAILAVYFLVLSATLAIFSLAIGKYIVDKIKNPTKGKFILFSILSAIVLWLLQIVPYIGGYITLFIFVVGLGVFLFAFFMRKDVSKIESKQE